jgi:RNA polymerase sigma factor (sigma-70 family)
VPPPPETTSDASFAELVEEAGAGSEAAWRELCGRLRGVVWRTIRNHRLAGADADDVYAATMFRLAEHLGRIREPERLPGWVATTARNEALAVFRMRKRVTVVGDALVERPATPEPDRLERDELHDAVRRSFALLDERCQQLLRISTADPPLPYEDVGALLGMPHGSIGPTRRRCLDALRSKPPLRAFLEAWS